jgi:DNA invertase Pin-like site-specific DNA recombinase
MPQFVAYFRVSTVRQGQSGLGLEAQQAAVQNFLRADAQLVATFLEIESGKKNERPQLAAAIARARQEGAVLLVAKLDRLARNVAFLATLMESRVRFQAVDLPAVDEFTLHIMAAVAQKAASAISTRTRDALTAKKVRGAQLGTPTNLTQAAREKSWAAMTQNAKADLNNRQAAQLATLLRATEATLRAIAEQLNQSGYRTRHGKSFRKLQISGSCRTTGPRRLCAQLAGPGCDAIAAARGALAQGRSGQ